MKKGIGIMALLLSLVVGAGMTEACSAFHIRDLDLNALGVVGPRYDVARSLAEEFFQDTWTTTKAYRMAANTLIYEATEQNQVEVLDDIVLARNFLQSTTKDLDNHVAKNTLLDRYSDWVSFGPLLIGDPQLGYSNGKPVDTLQTRLITDDVSEHMWLHGWEGEHNIDTRNDMVFDDFTSPDPDWTDVSTGSTVPAPGGSHAG